MPELQRDTRRALAAALLDLPNITDQAVRSQLMLDWPPALRGNIALSNIPSIDLNSMIVTAAQWETPDGSKPPLVLLIENAQDLVRGSAEEGTLGDLLVAVQRDLAPAAKVLTDPGPGSQLLPPGERAACYATLVAAFRTGDYDQVVTLSHGLPSDYPGLAPLVQRAERGLQESKLIADKIAAAWADQQWDEVLRLAQHKPPPPDSVQPMIADAQQALAPPPSVVQPPIPRDRVQPGPESYTVPGPPRALIDVPSGTEIGWYAQLIAALAAVPAYAMRANRDMLLLDLPAATVGTIPRSDDPGSDLTAIVATLARWGTLEDGTPALATLLENAETLTPDAPISAQLKGWLAEVQSHPPAPLVAQDRFHALVAAYAQSDWPAVKAWAATLPADYPGLQPLMARVEATPPGGDRAGGT
jgi:hypothetical protein